MDFQHIVHFWNDNEYLSMQKLGHGKARVHYAPMIKFRFSKADQPIAVLRVPVSSAVKAL